MSVNTVLLAGGNELGKESLPVRCQAITLTDEDLFTIEHSKRNISEIWIQRQDLSWDVDFIPHFNNYFENALLLFDCDKTAFGVSYAPFHRVSKDDNNLGVWDQSVK